MIYNAKIRVLSLLIMLAVVGCGIDRKAEFEKLEENIEAYNDLRLLIESSIKIV